MKIKERFDYFYEFIMMTEYIVNSVNILKENMISFDVDKLETDISKVHRYENKADEVVHLIRNNLIVDFLPPIDREDIAVICKKLDNIEDGIDETLINFRILSIESIREEVVELVDILVMCCEAVNDMFLNLRKFKDIELINKKAIQINKLEEKGDRIYEKIVSLLFQNEKDSINIIKWFRIYNCLEETIDICEELSDSILDTVMKNT